MTLRVAWLGHRSTTGGDGIITYSREMTSGLRARGVDVTFFHHAQELGGDDSVALSALTLSHRLVISRPRARRILIERLKRHRFDIVHVSLSFSTLDFNLPRTCHQLGIPIVATFHVPFDTRFSVWGGISNAVYRIYAQPLSECDGVIIFGDTQRTILSRLGVPDGVIHVLPNGVDVEKYSPGPSSKRDELQAGRIFTYIGRLDPEKNVDILVRAFLDAEPPPDVKMVIVGGGVGRRRLERRYRDPRVVFTGTVTDESERIALLRASDAFFLPSSVEGLSLAMLEAMSCGVATVATDVGSDGDALRGAGLVIDPQSLLAELTASIRHLIDVPELCKVLGERARQRAVERFSLDRNLDQLIELYKAVVDAARSVQEPGRAFVKR
jgi:glycosyltransferase involved in cell wall biosynthesis